MKTFDLRGLLMPKDRNSVSTLRPLLSAGFLFSAAVLSLAAVALRPGVEALSEHYTKEPIAVRKPLSEFDVSRLPSFKSGWTRSDIPPDDIETDEYAIIRLSAEQPAQMPKEVVLFVTYYSDPESKVPHTPDVCYRQGGAVLKSMKNTTIAIPGLAQQSKITARLLLFRQRGYNQVVIFSFFADGQFRNSREQVRWTIGKPGNRHVYFSKIETVASYPTDGSPVPAINLCKKLFAEAVSILVSEHFPTKEQIKR
jgi:hypothetical protein